MDTIENVHVNEVSPQLNYEKMYELGIKTTVHDNKVSV